MGVNTILSSIILYDLDPVYCSEHVEDDNNDDAGEI